MQAICKQIIAGLLIVQLIPAHAGFDQSGAEYPAHVGEYVTSFNKLGTPSDKFIVVDQGPDNDRISYRDDSKQYDFTFDINIRRYIGDATDRANLLANHLISKTATIYIPAYDVNEFVADSGLYFDCDGDGVLEKGAPEIDYVYFNGVKIGMLHGRADTWVLNEASTPNIYEVPISSVNFPANPGETATNKVQIRIDAGNENLIGSNGGRCYGWYTAVDYVAFKYDVVDPFLLVAGLGGDPGIFSDADQNSNYVNALKSLGIQSKIISHSISADKGCYIGYTPSYYTHGEALALQAENYASLLGASNLNLIAHSKGGLDSRYFINRIYGDSSYKISTQPNVTNPLRIHSFTTLSTPHLGTAVADAVAYDMTGVWLLDHADEAVTDICDLTTYNTTKFNDENTLPRSIHSLSIGADADANGDGTLSDNELEYSQFSIYPNLIFYDIARYAYYLIKNNSVVSWVNTPVYDPVTGTTIEMPTNASIYVEGQLNDTLVGEKSAAGMGADKHVNIIGNHKTVVYKKNSGAIYTGGRDIVFSEGLNGILNWSVQP